MPSPFLAASWRSLIIVSYAVPDSLLTPRLPPNLELDKHNGSAFVSLVAFAFQNTRVMGIPWPGHVNFPELNLRFYVKRRLPDGDRRGVMFIREYVPRRAIAAVARLAYNEPYSCAPMSMRLAPGSAEYTLRRDSMSASAAADWTTPPDSSTEHWFKEHSWGYGVDRRGRVLEYEVRHPVWQVADGARVTVDVDWARLYGAEWSCMQGREPDSAVFAEGSAVEVFRPTVVGSA